MRSSSKFENHLPKSISFTALDDLDRFKTAECWIRRVKPRPERLGIKQTAQRLGEPFQFMNPLLAESLGLCISGFPVDDGSFGATQQPSEL